MTSRQLDRKKDEFDSLYKLLQVEYFKPFEVKRKYGLDAVLSLIDQSLNKKYDEIKKDPVARENIVSLINLILRWEIASLHKDNDTEEIRSLQIKNGRISNDLLQKAKSLYE